MSRVFSGCHLDVLPESIHRNHRRAMYIYIPGVICLSTDSVYVVPLEIAYETDDIYVPPDDVPFTLKLPSSLEVNVTPFRVPLGLLHRFCRVSPKTRIPATGTPSAHPCACTMGPREVCQAGAI